MIMSTVAAIPPSGCSAVTDLETSTRAISSAGRMSKLNSRPLESVARTRPLYSAVVNSGLSPRTEISVGSPAVALLPLTVMVETATPGMRSIASAMFWSGSLPMSSATIESTM
ncbi:hypothetical protein D9M73_111440 [compost metagenome]